MRASRSKRARSGAPAAQSSRREPVTTAALASLAVAATVLSLAGCSLNDSERPTTGLSRDRANADFQRGVGTPALATKNTVRIPGNGPVANAAGAALAVYPSHSTQTRPAAVSVVGHQDWQGAIAASVLMSAPSRAPVLLGQPGEVPEVTASALGALRPTGLTKQPGRPQVVAVGQVALPEGVRSTRVRGDDVYERAASIDRFRTRLAGRPSTSVIVVSAEPKAAAFSAPAGPLAALTGAPVLFVDSLSISPATQTALRARKRPTIYVVGPQSVIPERVVRRLRRFGSVTRISGPTPSENAVAVAIFEDIGFGWGVTDPGHGFVIADQGSPMNVAAATALAVSGVYGPLLLNNNPRRLAKSLEDFFLDIKPGYIDDPTISVPNRAWLLGGEAMISPAVQARVDALCEIVLISADNQAPLDELPLDGPVVDNGATGDAGPGGANPALGDTLDFPGSR